MLNSIQTMIDYLKFERNINPGARRFARGLESYYYFNDDLTIPQVSKLVEIYNEKLEENN